MNEPSRSRPWSGDVNNAVAQQADALATNRKLLREIVTVGLLAAGAEVHYSCDSVVAGTVGDGINRWDSDTDLVFAAAGVAHSWMVLRLPEAAFGDLQLLIDLESSATGSSASIYISVAGYTGGSTTTRPAAPSANDEFEITWGGAQVLEVTNGPYTWHLLWAADGSAIRLFVERAAGDVVAVCLLETVARAPAEWFIPVAAGWTFATGGGAGESAMWSGGTLRGHHAGTGTTIALQAPLPSVATDLGGRTLLCPAQASLNVPGTPLGVFRDLYFVDVSIPNLRTYPAGTSRRWMTFDDMVVPWPGVSLGGDSANAAVVPFEIQEGALVAAAPAAGSLGATEEEARWTPIVLTVTVPDGYVAFVHGYFGADPSLRHVVYDGASFAPFFAEHSTVTVDGAQHTLTILPIGGWWAPPTLVPGVFLESGGA